MWFPEDLEDTPFNSLTHRGCTKAGHSKYDSVIHEKNVLEGQLNRADS